MRSTTQEKQAVAPTTGLPHDLRPAGRARKSLAVLALLVAVPLAAVSAMRFFHNPAVSGADAPIAGLESIAWPRAGNRPSLPAQPTGEKTAVASVDSMIVGLEQRLAHEPGDAKGWALLAQSYAFLGNAQKADAALSKAVTAGFDETDLRRRLGLASETPGASNRQSLAAGSVAINGLVKLASASPLELAPESRLFVTAKAIDGSSIPVAVLGLRVTEFPYQFVLSEKDAMMPGIKLTDYEELALSARLSQSGTADRRESDLESAVKIVRLGDAGWVDLVIENR